MAEDVILPKSTEKHELLVDNALVMSDLGRTASFLDTQAEQLSRIMSDSTGIPIYKWNQIVKSSVGLPADTTLRDMLRQQLEGWLPVFAAGYSYCTPTHFRFADIPQIVKVYNQGPDLSPGRWCYSLHVLVGPSKGIVVPVSVNDRMAIVMLYKAAGPRMHKELPRPRLYDLHGMELVIGFQLEKSGHYIIRKIYESDKIKARNRRLMKEYLLPCVKNKDTQCFDCGASRQICSRGRHQTPLEGGPCVLCGRQLYFKNKKGVCTGCVQTQMITGRLPNLPTNA